MTIKYYIVKTGLGGKASYVGRVALNGTYNKEMLIDRMLQMGSGISKEEIEGVFSLTEKCVLNICKEGNKINIDGLVQFTPTLGGVFKGETDSYDENRNDLYITAQISSALNNAFKNEISVEKIITLEKRPYIIEVADNDTGEINQLVTPNNIITLYGEYMKFAWDDNDEYLRFINAENPVDYIAIAKCQKITDKEIVFLLPSIAFKKGYFEISTKMETNNLRSGRSQIVDVK